MKYVTTVRKSETEKLKQKIITNLIMLKIFLNA